MTLETYGGDKEGGRDHAGYQGGDEHGGGREQEKRVTLTVFVSIHHRTQFCGTRSAAVRAKAGRSPLSHTHTAIGWE